jgi:hypothetical protein
VQKARILLRGRFLLPFCSYLHHHLLKRRLTPAENEWPALLQHHCCGGVFIGREDSRARAVAQVLSAAQLCKREPADGADVFRQCEANTQRACASSLEQEM